MYSSDTINIAAENKRKNRQPEYCVRRPFKVCDGCVEATLGITTVTWAQVNLHLTTVKVFKDSQLKIPQSDYINFNNYGEKTRQHSYQVWSCACARTEVTSGLCLYIGLLVAPATNTVKVISNEVGLRLLCCGMCFTYIHLFEATRHNIKTFQKGFVE